MGIRRRLESVLTRLRLLSGMSLMPASIKDEGLGVLPVTCPNAQVAGNERVTPKALKMQAL